MQPDQRSLLRQAISAAARPAILAVIAFSAALLSQIFRRKLNTVSLSFRGAMNEEMSIGSQIRNQRLAGPLCSPLLGLIEIMARTALESDQQRTEEVL